MRVPAGADSVDVLAAGEGNGEGDEIVREQVREGDPEDGEHGDQSAE